MKQKKKEKKFLIKKRRKIKTQKAEVKIIKDLTLQKEVNEIQYKMGPQELETSLAT